MTMYGLSCGYWTDVKKEHTEHVKDHAAAGGYKPTVISAKELPKNFQEIPGAMRGCFQGVGSAHVGGKV